MNHQAAVSWVLVTAFTGTMKNMRLSDIGSMIELTSRSAVDKKAEAIKYWLTCAAYANPSCCCSAAADLRQSGKGVFTAIYMTFEHDHLCMT